MKSLGGFLIAAFLVGGLSVAFGADEKDKKKDKPKSDFEAQFKKLDDNKNGFLVQAEYVGNKTGEAKEAALKLFRRKDKDKDLQLTLEEFKRDVPAKKPNKKKNAKK